MDYLGATYYFDYKSQGDKTPLPRIFIKLETL